MFLNSSEGSKWASVKTHHRPLSFFDDEEQDEIFDTEEAAEEYALYLCSCHREGSEILHMSNPGDYDYDEDEYESPDYEIIEVEIDD